MQVTSPRHLRLVESVQKNSETGYVNPEHLHEVLRPAYTKIVTFKSEKAMRSYRSMLYTINRQGDFKFATRRDEQSMWGIIIIRLL